MEEINTVQNQKPTRPTFLSVLCVLTFVFVGFSLLFGLLGLAQGKLGDEAMLQQKVELIKSADEMRSLDMEGFATMMEQISRMSESINSHFYAASILSIVVMGIGLFGAIKMWKGSKLGFHLYIIYSLLTITQIYFFVSSADVPVFVVLWNLAISGIFVFMYSRNLKWLS